MCACECMPVGGKGWGGGGSVFGCGWVGVSVHNIVNDFVKFWIRIADFMFGGLIIVLSPRSCSSIKIQKNITEALCLQLFVLNVK